MESVTYKARLVALALLYCLAALVGDGNETPRKAYFQFIWEHLHH